MSLNSAGPEIPKMDSGLPAFDAHSVGPLSQPSAYEPTTYVDVVNRATIPSSYFTPQTVQLGNITARYVRFRYDILCC
jgi:hypothetical protein